MKIFITAFTAGRGGNGLESPLRYFNKYIETTLCKNGFTSSFAEFSVRFSYLPLYVLPGMAGTENVFMEYYNQLPECRINRRYQRIETAVKAPEFSEHFDKKDQFKYKHKFDIAEKYKTLSDVQLAGIVIDKLLEAAALTRAKLKKNDVFDFRLFEEILASIKQSITTGLLEKINKEEESNWDEKQVAVVNQSRAERKLTRHPADTLIRDIRLFYAYELPRKLLYLDRYANVVLNILIREGLVCPGYHHLYISIADTREKALRQVLIVENWFTYGIAILPEKQLLEAGPEEQADLVLQALKEGLLDIAELDGLDIKKIEAAIHEAGENGLLAEFPVKIKENNRIRFEISIKGIAGKNIEEIYFTVIDKQKKRMAKWKVGEEHIFTIMGWFGTLTVTNKSIRTKPRSNMDLVLKGKQKEFEIDIEKVLAGQ